MNKKNKLIIENLPEYNILIIDDQPANLKVLAGMLRDKNYKVRKAIDGESAIEAIEIEPPDLILLDILMLGMDGYEVCKNLKSNAQTKDIPIIFISALSEVFDKVKAFEMGGIDYITKPFQEEEVLARIENQLMIQQQKQLLEKKQQQLEEEKKKLKAEIKRRKETEAILYQSRALISSILNSSLDGITAMEAVRDKKTGNITDFSCLVVNPIIAKVVNISSEDLIGKLVPKKFLNKINSDLFPSFVEVVETGKSLEKDMYYNYQQEEEWYHFIIVKLGDGIALTARNITARKNLELNLKETNQELEAFNYSVAHDLRNPLGNIQSLIYLLKEEYQNYLSPDTQQYFELMTESTTRMQQIIKDLLMLSQIKKNELTFELVDLSVIVYEILMVLQFNEPERKAELIIEPQVIAKIDRGFFTIVLENLIGNAWKYSSKKEITQIEFGVLSAEKEELDLIINQCCLFKDKSLCQQKSDRIYFIKDNGAGFNIENPDELFTPFKRFHSESEFEGTGIGLSIVERIINRHQGLIWCKSQVGEGTTFYFTLNN